MPATKGSGSAYPAPSPTRIKQSPKGSRFARRVPARASPAKRPSSAKSEGRTTARPAHASRKPLRRRKPLSGTVKPLAPTRPGVIAHTEFASSDVEASRSFFVQAFGWNFEAVERPDGPYELFRTPQRMGGGIRQVEPGETPRVVPFVEMRDLASAQQVMTNAGGRILVPRIDLAEGQGSYFLCQAPGGIVFGVWAPK